MLSRQMLCEEAVEGAGSPGFMSPELISNQISSVSSKSDLFSVGLIIYRL